MDDLTRRFDRLERSNRRWRSAALALGGLVVAGLLSGARVGPSSLSLDSLTIEDDAGNDRITMQTLPDGSPAIGLLDEKGNLRGSFGLQAHGGALLRFFDEKHKSRLELASAPDGSPGISLAADDLKRQLLLFAAQSGSTSLIVTDSDGKTRASFGLTSDGDEAIRLRGADSKPVFDAPSRPKAQQKAPSPR